MNIPCPKCKGTGNMVLPPQLAKTLKTIKRVQPCDFATVSDASDRVSQCALANRIKRLIDLGFVVKSDERIYSVNAGLCNPQPEKP